MTTLRVQRRNMETKAKKLRREGYVTGNLFGKEIEGSIPVQIEKSEAERIQRECMKGSQLYLELEGKTYDVLIKEMDYNTMNHQILEMDFQALVKGEKVHSVAEIVLTIKRKLSKVYWNNFWKRFPTKPLRKSWLRKWKLTAVP